MQQRHTRRTILTVAVPVIAAACGDAATPSPTPAAKSPVAIVPQAAPATVAAGAPTVAPAATSSAAIKRGGQLRIMQTNDFVSMDPIHASGPTARACFDSLFTWRPNAQGQYAIGPMLAQSWEVSANRLVIKLRQGVTFHDGSPLDAETIVWNLKRMTQNPKSFARNFLAAIDEANPAVAVDASTVQVNLKRPSASVLTSLSDANGNTPIVSKKAADTNGEEWLKLNPVGTGPFKFVSFASGDKLVVTKNDTYWQAGSDGKPMPYVDGITYRVITDAATQFAEMRANSSDFAQNVRGRDVPAARQISHATYVETPFGGNKRQYFFSATKEPFKDNLKLRQAVNHAVDREAISKAVGGGLGIALPYEFIPGATGYDASLPFYEFNLDKAKQLIKESGVTLPLSVRLTAHNREQDVQQAEMLQQMLDKIGVKIVLDIIERVAWGEKVRIQNDFIMASRQSGVAVDPTDDLLVTWAESGNSAYHRGKVPGLLDTLQKADAEYDGKKRQELFGQAQRLMHESAWFGYMWFENGNFLVNNRVKGFPATWGSFREWEWFIN